MQLCESKINQGGCTTFVKDFRIIEFKMRDFVETKLRNAVSYLNLIKHRNWLSTTKHFLRFENQLYTPGDLVKLEPFCKICLRKVNSKDTEYGSCSLSDTL